jgi:hypothetical protein
LSRAEHETTDGEQKKKGAVVNTTLIISTTNNIKTVTNSGACGDGTVP